MKKVLAILTGFSLLILLWGCPSPKPEHTNAYFPSSPQNLVDVNTAYDDYNSAFPGTQAGKYLIFSTNRWALDDDFDIVGDNFHATWDMESGELRVGNQNLFLDLSHLPDMLEAANSDLNEYAPYSIGYEIVNTDDDKRQKMTMLIYSSGCADSGYCEYLVYNISDFNAEPGTTYGPSVVANLGDEFQQYVSFYGLEVESLDLWELNPDNFTQMYFDESANGNSDIYKIDIPLDSPDFLGFLKDTAELQKDPVKELNSNANDRCPFINGNMMVFTSDRPGGYGGYDLYYSVYNGVQWSEPVNFGEEINSAYDEFRPVALQVYNFENDLMIFSSNRPGGQGGYDLYYVGIDKISQDE